MTEIKQVEPKPLTRRQQFDGYISRVINDRCATFLNEPEQRQRLQRLVMALVPRNNKILECTPQSVAMCLLFCAELGLEPSTTTGHCWLIPRWSKQAQSNELTFMVGYKGYLALAHRCGNIRTIYSGCVYEGEQFDIMVDSNGMNIRHVPRLEADFDRSDDRLIASYVIVSTTDGGTYSEWCSRAEIDKRRKAGGARKFSPWSTHFERMARKCAVRKLFGGGTVPMTGNGAAQLAKAVQIESDFEMKMIREAQQQTPAPLSILAGDAEPIDGLFDGGEE